MRIILYRAARKKTPRNLKDKKIISIDSKLLLLRLACRELGGGHGRVGFLMRRECAGG
jgi:hypothetical protein